MSMATDIETYVKHTASSLVSLAAAWEFVMSRVDEFETPSIEISPFWRYNETEDGALYYTATVSGHHAP
jgi:hypothetical protein